MISIKEYIVEKLVIDTNLNKSKFADIYKVNIDDKVLVVTKVNETRNGKIKLYVAKISAFDNDKIFLKNNNTNKRIDELEFTFENPQHTTKRVEGCFGFWKGTYKEKDSWVAICQKDRAIQILKGKLKYIKNAKFTWNGVEIKANDGKTVEDTLQDIINELEKD